VQPRPDVPEQLVDEFIPRLPPGVELTVNRLSRRLGAIGKSLLLSVLTLKRRLPFAQMPCSRMSF